MQIYFSFCLSMTIKANPIQTRIRYAKKSDQKRWNAHKSESNLAWRNPHCPHSYASLRQ